MPFILLPFPRFCELLIKISSTTHKGSLRPNKEETPRIIIFEEPTKFSPELVIWTQIGRFIDDHFFEKAAFYGGTALRIFYELYRYLEDLDFALLQPDPDFYIEPYFKEILDEFKSLGLNVSIKEKKKTKESEIDSAFLKS